MRSEVLKVQPPYAEIILFAENLQKPPTGPSN